MRVEEGAAGGTRVHELGPYVVERRALGDGTRVLVKRCKAERPSAEDADRLRREAALLGSVTARGVLSLRGLRDTAGRVELHLDDPGGEPLTREMERGRATALRAATLGATVARALADLHAAGLLHGDVRPATLWVTGDDARLSHLVLAARLSRRNELCEALGTRDTLAYLAPEGTGRTGHSVDERLDLYALGVTLYELVAGRLPFASNDALELMHAHLARVPQALHVVDPATPPDLSAVVARLLAKSADDRYESAFGVARDLEAVSARLTRGDATPIVVGAADVRTRLRLPQELIGRDEERGTLLATLARASRGPCEVCAVTGRAGVGKSALLAELDRPIAEQRGWLGRGKFEQLRRDQPHVGVAQALGEVVRQIVAAGRATLDAVKARIVAALGDNAGVVCALVPELRLLLDAHVDVSPLGPEESRVRFFAALQAFARALPGERSVTLVVDDLQWADEASLTLIERLATDRELRRFFIVCAYRDDEVGDAHPIRLLLDRLEQRSRVTHLSVGPLGVEGTGEFVAHALGWSRTDASALARLAHEKTGGNPFFLGQLVWTLAERGLARFDPAHGAFVVDLAGAEALALSDNVVSLLVEQIADLEYGARRLLTLAACCGAEFDAETLALISGATPRDVVLAVGAAADRGLVRPLPTSDGRLRWRFLHDRVEQAAYTMLPDAERAAAHVSIGRLLFAGTQGAELEARALEISLHVNRGKDLLIDRDERRALAELELVAGRRARAANAWAVATDVLEAAGELAGDDAWRGAHEFAYALTVELAESALLDARFDVLDRAVDTIVQHARTDLERSRAHELRLLACSARHDFGGALSAARAALAELDTRLPARANLAHAGVAVLRVKLALSRRSNAEILALPPAVDERTLVTLRVLGRTRTVCYLSEPELLPVLIWHMVRLTLAHGVSGETAVACALYGVVAAGALGDFETAYRMADLSEQLVAQRDLRAERATVLMTNEIFVRHWKDPLRDTLEPLLEAYRVGLDSGDAESAIVASMSRCFHAFFAGVELERVVADCERFAEVAARFGQERFVKDVHQVWQLCACVMGRASDPSVLRGEYYDGDLALADSRAAKDTSGIAGIHFARMYLGYLFGDLDRAWRDYLGADAASEGLMASLFLPLLSMFGALIALGRARRQTGLERARSIRVARRQLAQLEKWARFSPANVAHRIALVQGELAWLGGDGARGASLFERAADLATRGGWTSEAAIAHERAAELHTGSGRTTAARAHALAARNEWARWGALAKVQEIDQRFAGLGPALLGAGAREVGSTQLDAASAIKGALAIAGEIALERLLERLLAIAVENAGAERGLIALDTEGLCLRAELADDTVRTFADGSEPVASSELGPAALLEYAARTGEAIVLDDAAHSGRFSDDAWVQRHRSRSALALPIVHQRKTLGVLFLENRLVPGAFTHGRLELLGVIAAQAAVALENARLYANLESALGAQIQLTEANRRFVPAEFLDSLGKPSIAEVKLGDSVQKPMTVCFSDLRGFTALVEGMTPEQNIAFINEYLSYMEPAIVQHGGFVDSYIGDAIMALFDGGAERGVRAALAMHEALGRLNARRAERGEPPMRMGIGLNTGVLTLGTIGGPGRIKCGVIGDSVNLAARIESLTKTYDAPLLVSEHTLSELPDTLRRTARRVDRVRVLGRGAAVDVYELLDADDRDLALKKRSTLEAWHAAQELVFARRFDAAARAFGELERDLSTDGAARLWLARSRDLAARPPGPGWTGVFDLDHK